MDDMKKEELQRILVSPCLFDMVAVLQQMCGFANETARANGFYDNCASEISQKITALALIHEEVAEATRALRKGNPESEKIPGFRLLEEELADIVIRVCDLAGEHNLELGAAIKAKMAFNLTREYKHGQKF